MSWKTFLTFGVAFASIAETSVQRTLYASAPVDRGAYYVRGKNVYNYGYNTGDGIAKVEARHADGSVTGSYRYFDPLGRQIVRSYIADEKGFRVLGNDLPVAPQTPALGVLRDETLYATAEGTGDNASTKEYTSSFLFNNQLGRAASARHPYFRKSKHDKIAVKHSKIIKQQDSLIQQYEKQLSELRAQRERLQRRYSQPQQYVRSDTGYGPSTLQNSFNGIYFYHDNKRNYDFPAGFAYLNSRPSLRSTKDLLVIDDTPSRKVVHRPLYRRRSSSPDRW